MLIVNISKTTMNITLKGYGLVRLEPEDSHSIKDTFYLDEIKRVVNIFGKENLLIMSEDEYKKYKEKSDVELEDEIEDEVMTGDLTAEQLDEMTALGQEMDLNSYTGEFQVEDEDAINLFLNKVDNLINHKKLDKPAKLKALKKIADYLEIKFDGRIGLTSLRDEINKKLKGGE